MKSYRFLVLLPVLGSFALGCGSDRPATAPGPAGPVTDLYANEVTDHAATLSWTAPAGSQLPGNRYDLRYLAEARSAEGWAAATPVDSLPAPGKPGRIDYVTVDGLQFGTVYRFRLRTGSDAGGWSEWEDLTLMTEPPEATPVAAAPVLAQSGAWSPDGSELAYVRYLSGHGDIWIHSLNGGPERQVTTTGMANLGSQLSWSPDGAHIAFLHYGCLPLNCFDFLYILAVGTGKLSQVASAATSPAWSPDGSRLAYATESGGNPPPVHPLGIWMRDIGTNENTHLMPDDVELSDLHWSPDGTEILYCLHPGFWQTQDGLWVARVDKQSPPRRLTDLVHCSDAQWSPDGHRVLVSGALSSQPGILHLWWVDLDGESLTPVSDVIRLQNGPIALSPDGRSVLCLGSTTHAGTGLFVVASDGFSIRLLTRDGHDGLWSTNGHTVAFNVITPGAQSVWTAEVR